MNKKHFFFCTIIVTICITLFSACKESVTDITLNKNELNLVPGETEKLVATIYPKDATNNKITWVSSDPNVATVSDDGLVSAINNGNTTITVTTQDGNKKATCLVTVEHPVTNITLNKNELTLIPGETEKLIATIYPENATNKEIAWASNNPNVATVNDDGLVTAITNGKATITATTQDGNKKATCDVIVDFRAQWVGDWDFITHKFWFEGEMQGNDTIYYLGKISYGKKTDELKVKYIALERDTVILKINENGTIIDISSVYGNGNWNGYFDGTEIFYLYIRSTTDGHGGGGTHTINGIKKERRQK